MAKHAQLTGPINKKDDPKPPRICQQKIFPPRLKRTSIHQLVHHRAAHGALMLQMGK
jgi:hypothetical protein